MNFKVQIEREPQPANWLSATDQTLKSERSQSLSNDKNKSNYCNVWGNLFALTKVSRMKKYSGFDNERFKIRF